MKYYQEIQVRVPSYLKYKEIEGRIIKISRTGIVKILFNQEMQPISNLSLITNKTLQLRIVSKYLKNVNFTWNCTEYSKN